MAVVWHFPRTFSKQEGMCKRHRNWGRKRSRWLKALAVKPDDPSSNPRSYMVEGEDDSLKLFSDVHMNIIYTHHTHHTSHISSEKNQKSELCSEEKLESSQWPSQLLSHKLSSGSENQAFPKPLLSLNSPELCPPHSRLCYIFPLWSMRGDTY